MKQLRFEKVGDINFKFPYLEVFVDDGHKPIVDIGISNNRAIEITFYKSEDDIKLSLEKLKEIIFAAESFLPEALENGDNSE